MALKKAGLNTPKPAGERRDHARSYEDLARQLVEGEAAARRWAARDLADYPTAVELLCARLPQEPDLAVREAIFDTLLRFGNAAVVNGLLPLLRSDDAALRNTVIETLQALPLVVAPQVQRLLADPDSDVRIFAIDILRSLAHPAAPQWLSELLARETHVNVIGQALDCVAEIGTPEMVPALTQIKERFAQYPYIGFAADMAIARINGAVRAEQ